MYEGDPDNGGILISPSDLTATEFFVEGLNNNQQYIFYVRGSNIFGDDPLASVIATPLAMSLPAPQNFRAGIGTSGQVNLSWSAVLGATGYRIYDGNPDLGGTLIRDISDSAATAYTVMGLTDGVTYTFFIVAYNLEGDSPAAQLTAIPQEF